MTQPGFRKIIHPDNGNVAEVPISSLAQHYAAGWAPLDESTEPPPPSPDPEPVRASAAKKTSKEGE
jgi:hypothetical protein